MCVGGADVSLGIGTFFTADSGFGVDPTKYTAAGLMMQYMRQVAFQGPLMAPADGAAANDAVAGHRGPASLFGGAPKGKGATKAEVSAPQAAVKELLSGVSSTVTATTKARNWRAGWVNSVLALLLDAFLGCRELQLFALAGSSSSEDEIKMLVKLMELLGFVAGDTQGKSNTRGD